jgi:hypothetical protein
MKKRTAQLSGPALDWAVAKCEGKRIAIWPAIKDMQKLTEVSVYDPNIEWFRFSPSTNWAQAGPIIERRRICLVFNDALRKWEASPSGRSLTGAAPPGRCRASAALVAAMRCLVATELGKTVDVPDRLFITSSSD